MDASLRSRAEQLAGEIATQARTAEDLNGLMRLMMKSALERMGIPAGLLQKVGEGSPNVVDCIESGEVSLVVNTPTGSGARADGWQIRRAAVARGVPCLTTLSGALAAARAIASARHGQAEVLSLQEIHRPSRAARATA